MNKQLAILAIFGLVGCVLAEQPLVIPGLENETDSQFSVVATDDQETAHLKDGNEIFSQFCIEARDEAAKYVKDSLNGAASMAFSIMLGDVESIESAGIEAGSQATEEGAKLIAEHSAMPAEGTLSSPDEVKEKLEETVENTSLIGTISNAVKVVINAAIEAARSTFVQKLALMRQRLDGDNLKQAITDACQSLSFNLHGNLERRLTKFKGELRNSAAKSKPDLLTVINKANLQNTGCLTAGRVAKLNMVCSTLMMAGNSIWPLLGLGY